MLPMLTVVSPISMNHNAQLKRIKKYLLEHRPAPLSTLRSHTAMYSRAAQTLYTATLSFANGPCKPPSVGLIATITTGVYWLVVMFAPKNIRKSINHLSQI